MQGQWTTFNPHPWPWARLSDTRWPRPNWTKALLSFIATRKERGRRLWRDGEWKMCHFSQDAKTLHVFCHWSPNIMTHFYRRCLCPNVAVVLLVFFYETKDRFLQSPKQMYKPTYRLSNWLTKKTNFCVKREQKNNKICCHNWTCVLEMTRTSPAARTQPCYRKMTRMIEILHLTAPTFHAKTSASNFLSISAALSPSTIFIHI